MERIQGEVTEIKMADRRAKIFVQHHGNFFTDKVVLALGNFPPRNPPVKNRSFLNSKRYIQNPWSSELFSFLLLEDTVFFIGTGQTMVDLAISLHIRQHKGKIIAISRHGYLPMAHRNSGWDCLWKKKTSSFITIYKGSVVSYEFVDCFSLDENILVVISSATLQCPSGPLAGENKATQTIILTNKKDNWLISAFHNTLVMKNKTN